MSVEPGLTISGFDRVVAKTIRPWHQRVSRNEERPRYDVYGAQRLTVHIAAQKPYGNGVLTQYPQGTCGSDKTHCLGLGRGKVLKMMDSAERNGKNVVQKPTKHNGKYKKQAKEVTRGNIAYYTIQKLRSGRRSQGSSVCDVYAIGTQVKGHSRMTSLDDVAGTTDDGEVFEFHDVLSNDQEDPATKAARRMDWDSFMNGLSKREQAIILCMIEGKPLSGLARRKRINPSTIMYSKNRLASAIQEYMGSDIIKDIQRRPGWKESINCSRERLACREERRHL